MFPIMRVILYVKVEQFDCTHQGDAKQRHHRVTGHARTICDGCLAKVARAGRVKAPGNGYVSFMTTTGTGLVERKPCLDTYERYQHHAGPNE